MIDQCNFDLSTDEHVCYQHTDANDVAYLKFLIDEAEKFFNERIKELEQVCINQLIDMFISGSKSSQLTGKSYLDSKAVLPMQTYGNEKQDPLR